MSFSVASRVAGLGALTAAGQLLIVGTLPLYSRTFDPSAYGEYIVFVGAYTVVSVLAGIRYDSAIVLPRNDGLALALSSLVLCIGLAVSALLALLTSLTVSFGWLADHWETLAARFGYGLAVATAVGTMMRCLSGWCIRRGRFLLMGWGQFIFSLVTVVAQLSFARLSSEFSALVWGYVCALGCQVACLALFWVRPGNAVQSGSRAVSLRSMALVARKYRRFPTYMVGYALASSVRDRLIQVVLALGSGAAAVGRFGLAYRVVFAPNSLLYSAISPVFFAIASRGSRAEVGRFAAGLVEATFVFLVVPYAAFAIEAPALTDALLSEKWRGTGPYLQALAAPALLLAATCWLDRAFDSFRQQRVAFALEATFTLVSVAVVGATSHFAAPTMVAWTFGGFALIYYWVYFLTTFVACGFSLEQFRRACGSAALAAIAALILGAATHQLGSWPLRLAAYALLMTAIIAAWIRMRGGADILRALFRSRVHSHST
jgi:O-antigen/teichoic acid export membrane protein